MKRLLRTTIIAIIVTLLTFSLTAMSAVADDVKTLTLSPDGNRVNFTISDGNFVLATEELYEATLPSNINSGAGITFRVGGHYLTYKLSSSKIQWTDAVGSKTKPIGAIQSSTGSIQPSNSHNKVTYPNAFVNTNIEYYADIYGLKEYLVLSTLPYNDGKITDSHLEYTGELVWDRDLSVWVNGIEYPNKTFTTSSQIDFKNSAGERIFYLPAPTAWDSTGAECSAVYDVKVSTDKIRYGLRVPYSWLETATFPVTIDPTETLRPDAAGDVTQLTKSGAGGANWDRVDEEVSDEDSTYVYHQGPEPGSFDRYDLYNLPAHSVGSDTINSIRVYTRCRNVNIGGVTRAYTKIKIGGAEYTGGANTLASAYNTYSTLYGVNPNSEVAWTWDDIDALQIGVRLWGDNPTPEESAVARCTQVYVTVDYTPITVPAVTTQAMSEIEETTATGHGTITDVGGTTLTAWGICWNITSSPTTSNSTANGTGDGGVGAFTASLTELITGTLYYVKAYATNSEGTSYGSEVEFTTKGPPTITADDATNVAYTTARLNSTLDIDGGESCEVRFQYNTSENWVSCDNTSWIEGYTTGQHPYVDVEDLIFNTPYYFRAQAKNSIDTDNSTSKTFTTESNVFEPTNLKSFPESEQVLLSWTKGGGSTDTHVRYSEATYPTTIAEGTLVYSGILGSCVHSDLPPGHTYYYSVWGKSGTTYSDNYTTVLATTLAATAAEEGPDAPTMPPTWFQAPDYTVLAALPLYGQMNAAFDAFEMPRASGWFFSAILGCIGSGVLVFLMSKNSVPALITLAVAFAVVSLIKLVPMWMMAFTVLFALGAFQFGRMKAA